MLLTHDSRLTTHYSYNLHQIRTVWSNFQILSSIPDAMGVNFPEPAASFYAAISDITSLSPLNLVSAACFNSSFASYKVYVIATSFLFLVVCVLIWDSYGVSVVLNRRAEEEDLRVKNEVLTKHMWAFLFVTYLCYPGLSRIQFEALDCSVEVDGEWYLR